MAKKKHRVWVKVTKQVPIDVEADDKPSAEKEAKQKAEKGDYGGVAPPAQVPEVEIISVDELPDELDHEEQG